ncbi:hypothetical protein [Comamonas jiangduensis]|uniref:hypothetical protein n=1 Tax=Comamonas jiangduensis TaxID=1194168 RepID=UPI003526600E
MQTHAQKHMAQYPVRPSVTKEILLKAAQELLEELELDEDPNQLASIYAHWMDGYELAKRLDLDHGWSVDAQLVEYLDEFRSNVESKNEHACKAWAQDNNVQPPHSIGTQLHEGKIAGVSPYHPAAYLVDHGRTDSKLIINFENAITPQEWEAKQQTQATH